MVTDAQQIRLAAMNILAIREHSEVELRVKLLRKFTDISLIDAAIGQLSEQQLLSDRRFAESFISMRYRQLKGPLLIGLELKSKGVGSILIEACMEELNLDWALVAQKAKIKKFGTLPPESPKDKAKQIRYLQTRGFSGSHIRAIFDGGE